MSIDYERWKHALAMTETFNRPGAWGDYNSYGLPLACGRWQIHPVFLARWWPMRATPAWDSFTPTDTTTWDELFEACLRTFFNALAMHAGDATILAGWFHEHGGQGPLQDQAYMERFSRYYHGGQMEA